jgi:hypothetical protein
MSAALAATAVVLATAFTLALVDRVVTRRRPHEIAWAASLGTFALASVSLLIGESLGWPEWLFRSFYLLGGVACVPLLALGTVLLLSKKLRTRQLVTWGTIAWTLIAVGVVLAAPLTAALPTAGLPEGKEFFGVLPRVFAAAGSAIGSIVVVGGAIYSAARVRVARVVVANTLIAAGTFIIAGKGFMPEGLSDSGRFSMALSLGVATLLAGFMVATWGTSQAQTDPGARVELNRRPLEAVRNPPDKVRSA